MLHLGLVLAHELRDGFGMPGFEIGELLLGVFIYFHLRLSDRRAHLNLPSRFLIVHEKLERLTLRESLGNGALQLAFGFELHFSHGGDEFGGGCFCIRSRLFELGNKR